jgi:hypothetical protein
MSDRRETLEALAQQTDLSMTEYTVAGSLAHDRSRHSRFRGIVLEHIEVDKLDDADMG